VHDRDGTAVAPIGIMLGILRSMATVVALGVAVSCVIAAVAWAQPAPGQPDPEQLAARERHPWLGLIPVVFLALVAGYAVTVAARRRGRGRRRSGPPSTQDPPPIATPAAPDRRRDTASR
jgi:hypothetical protein